MHGKVQDRSQGPKLCHGHSTENNHYSLIMHAPLYTFKIRKYERYRYRKVSALDVVLLA